MVKDYKPRRKVGTEFEGKMEESGVHGKGTNALTASEKMRLTYRTGQEIDPTKKPSNRSWEGLREKPDSVVDKKQDEN